MTMTDPIADMLARIRNGLAAGKKTVEMPASNSKREILRVMEEEGYIRGVSEVEGAKHPTISVELKYSGGKPVITEIHRLSRPGLRRYSNVQDIPAFRNGLGTIIMSTPKGVMTDTAAKEAHIGGELLCKVF